MNRQKDSRIRSSERPVELKRQKGEKETTMVKERTKVKTSGSRRVLCFVESAVKSMLCLFREISFHVAVQWPTG